MVIKDNQPPPQPKPQPKNMQDKPKGARGRRRSIMKFHFLCMPNLRPNSSTTTTTTTTHRVSPMSLLLERFREAVFRLIMLSALSKATHQGGPGEARHRSYYRPPYEAHDHSEAVADCIEFIKKSATAEDNRSSTSSSCVDGTAEVAIPLPVM